MSGRRDSRSEKDSFKKLRHIFETGGHEAEPEFVELLKEWKPETTKEELLLRIRQFHDAVNVRQSRDRGSD